MRVKLLKRVRERCSIVYYPNGYKYFHKGCEAYIPPCILITDNHWSHITTHSTIWKYYRMDGGQNKAEIFKISCHVLKEHILAIYSHHGTRRIKRKEENYNKSEVLWHDRTEVNKKAYELQQAKKSWDA